MAKIIYTIERYNYGEGDKQTGWWLQRVTIALKDGVPDRILDRKPLAKFDCADATAEVLALDQAIKSGEFKMLEQEWNFASLKLARR